MSTERRRTRPRRPSARADLLRLVAIGVLASVMVGAARGVIAQDTADAPPPVPAPAPVPSPAPAPAGSRPSVDVSADAAVDFPGDI